MLSLKKVGVFSVLGLALAIPSGLASAQDPPLAGKKQQPAPPDDERGGRGEGRRGPRGGGAGMFDPQAMVDNLTENLNLTPEQQKSVKEIIDKRMAAMRNGDNIKPENREKFRELQEQMRQAREDGDRDKMREIGQQIREVAGDQREAMQKSREEMRQQIRAVLTPDQQKKFDEMPQMMPGGRGRGGPVTARVLHDAVMRLELGADQKAKIEAIFEKNKEAEKNLKRDDRQARTELSRKLHDDVVAVLTADQSQQLERNLQRAQGGGRGGRGDGEGRRGQRGGRGQPGQDLRGGDNDKDG